ncbi:MAG TPA: hypothetical protein VFV71_11890 [Burkholderiales bacterium]|nr:hypothetical protein [Burkholderiales bacterium]
MKLLAALSLSLLLLAKAWAGEPEFGGRCAWGMSQGYAVSTDCSVLWLGPDDKVYCFLDQAAKDKFLQAPKENLSRAEAAWTDPSNLKRLIKRE